MQQLQGMRLAVNALRFAGTC